VEDRLHPPRHHHARVILEQMAERLQLIAVRLTGGRLLDFGAGNSPYSSVFAASFDEIVTVDLCGLGADLDLDADGKVPASDDSFDCVLSTQVLEHVPDVQTYLAEARRVLVSDGTLILSTHGVYQYHEDPADYWRWTKSGLQSVLMSAGFVVEEVHPVVPGPAAPLTMTLHLLSTFVPRYIRPLWHIVSQSLVALTLRLSTRREWDDAAVYLTVSKVAQS
jgi:SAM-dependent methyltransferase